MNKSNIKKLITKEMVSEVMGYEVFFSNVVINDYGNLFFIVDGLERFVNIYEFAFACKRIFPKKCNYKYELVSTVEKDCPVATIRINQS